MFRSHFRPRTGGSAATAEGPSAGGLWDGVGPGRWREGTRPQTGGRERRPAVPKLPDGLREEAPDPPPSRPFGAGRRRWRGSKPNSCRPERPAGHWQGSSSPPQVSEVRPWALWGRCEGESLLAGRFLLDAAFEGPGVAVAAPGRLLPAGSGRFGALPGAAPDGRSLSPPGPLCPGVRGPRTPSPPHSAG